MQPLIERRAEATAKLERIKSRLDCLLDLAEERLVTKEEYAARRARLEGERAATERELSSLERDIAARAATTVDVDAMMRSM